MAWDWCLLIGPFKHVSELFGSKYVKAKASSEKYEELERRELLLDGGMVAEFVVVKCRQKAKFYRQTSKDDLHVLYFILTSSFKRSSHPEVGDLLRELPLDQALEVLPVLADQVPVGALGEGAHPQARDAALGTLQVKYLRLVSARGPEVRTFLS